MVTTPGCRHYRRFNGAVHPLNEARKSVQKNEATSVNGLYVAPAERAARMLGEGDVVAIWPPIAGG